MTAQIGNVKRQHRQPNWQQPEAEDGQEAKEAQQHQQNTKAQAKQPGAGDGEAASADFEIAHAAHASGANISRPYPQ